MYFINEPFNHREIITLYSCNIQFLKVLLECVHSVDE